MIEQKEQSEKSAHMTMCNIDVLANSISWEILKKDVEKMIEMLCLFLCSITKSGVSVLSLIDPFNKQSITTHL